MVTPDSAYSASARTGRALAWRSIIRQLVVQGFLRADPERFGALVLTEKSRALLRGEISDSPARRP